MSNIVERLNDKLPNGYTDFDELADAIVDLIPNDGLGWEWTMGSEDGNLTVYIPEVDTKFIYSNGFWSVAS